MSDKNIEMMKKIIEAKKQKSSQQGSIARADKSIGTSQKAFKNSKTGGPLDK